MIINKDKQENNKAINNTKNGRKTKKRDLMRLNKESKRLMKRMISFGHWIEWQMRMKNKKIKDIEWEKKR